MYKIIWNNNNEETILYLALLVSFFMCKSPHLLWWICHVYSGLCDRWPCHIPASTGEDVSRSRSDVDYVAGSTRWAIHIVVMILFVGIALVVMVRISLWVTTLVFIPFMIVTLASRLTMALAECHCQDVRSATGNVTGFISEVFVLYKLSKCPVRSKC